MLAPTRATALASTLADYLGWHLLTHCPQCGAMRVLRISDLAEQVGSDTLLRDEPSGLPRARRLTGL